jgi:hypothetical protein
MPLSEYEELRQVARAAVEAFMASPDVGIDLTTVEAELKWEALIVAIGNLRIVLDHQTAPKQA